MALPIDGVAQGHSPGAAADAGIDAVIVSNHGGRRLDAMPVDQVFQRTIDPGGVTGWHAHAVTTDRLFCAAGRVRLSLYDGRKSSPTYGNLWHRVFGAERHLADADVGHVPMAALLLNLVDRSYSYETPDHWRLPPDTPLFRSRCFPAAERWWRRLHRSSLPPTTGRACSPR
jgi:dTDP-4-dehydrorhamnose 3,5-epimerase